MRSIRLFMAALLSATLLIGTGAAGASPRPKHDRAACARVGGFTVAVGRLGPADAAAGPALMMAKAGVRNCGQHPARLRSVIGEWNSNTGAIVAVASPVATLAPGELGHGPTLVVFPVDPQVTYQVVALALTSNDAVLDCQVITVTTSARSPRRAGSCTGTPFIARSTLAAASRGTR